MNTFQTMFQRFNAKLASLGKTNPRFGQLPSAEAYGLTQADIDHLQSYLKKRLRFFSGSDGASELTLFESLDLEYPSKKKLITVLRALAKSASSEDRRRLNALIAMLLSFATESVKPQSESHAPAHESITAPFVGEQLEPEERKLYDLRLFAYNKAKDKDFFATKPAAASRFDGLSREALVNAFDKENFYRLSKAEVAELLQATANEYLLANGVQPCAVVFRPLKTTSGVQFGEYDPNVGEIVLNSKILDLFDATRGEKNQALAYQLMSTVIHESAHRVQFSKLGKDGLSKKDFIVTSALATPQSTLSHSEYLSSADELDARNEALRYMREMGLSTGSQALLAYYNVRKRKEMTNGKNPVSASVSANFSDIYDEQLLATPISLTRDNERFIEYLTSGAPLEPMA